MTKSFKPTDVATLALLIRFGEAFLALLNRAGEAFLALLNRVGGPLLARLYRVVMTLLALCVLVSVACPCGYAAPMMNVTMAAAANAENNAQDHILRVVYSDGTYTDHVLSVDDMQDLIQFDVSGNFTHRNTINITALSATLGSSEVYSFYAEEPHAPVALLTVAEGDGKYCAVTIFGGTPDLNWETYDVLDSLDSGSIQSDVRSAIEVDDATVTLRHLVYALNHGEENPDDVVYLHESGKTGVEIHLHYVPTPAPRTVVAGNPRRGNAPDMHSGAPVDMGSAGDDIDTETSNSGVAPTQSPAYNRIASNLGRFQN